MSEPTCINLMERFGEKYRIQFDEADDRRLRAIIDPRMLEIPCRRGVIYPYGGNVLAVIVDGRPKLAGELRRMACCKVIQDGETEKTFLFSLEHFPEVA